MPLGIKNAITFMSTINSELDSLLLVIRSQLRYLWGAQVNLEAFIPQWKVRTIRLLTGLLVPDEIKIFDSINKNTFSKDREAYIAYLSELEASVQKLPHLYLVQGKESRNSISSDVAKQKYPTSEFESKNVFIVHGHDTLAKLELARTLEKLKLSPIVLHEQVNEGRTIIEKFERDASRVSFAVVLLTPDDNGYPNGKPLEIKPRARQNVILELGYFTGVLGRHRVCVLHKGNVEVPSDYLGVVNVTMDEAGAWKFSLAKELKQAGLLVDLNELA